MIIVTLIAAVLGWIMSYAHGFQKEQLALKQIFGSASNNFELQVLDFEDHASIQLIDAQVFG